MRRAIAAAVVVAAAGAAAAWLALHGRPAPAAALAVPVDTARVARTDIVSHQRVNGVLGYGAPWTVAAPDGVAPGAVREAQAAAAAAQVALSSATQAAADTAAANQLAIAQAAGGDAAAQALARLRADQARHQADAQVAAARTGLANAQAALQAAQATARLDGSVTWLPAVGAVVQQGQPLYAVGGRPVVLLYGDQPAYRQLTVGVSGEDVRQLERDLIALGFATPANLAVDGGFTSADAAAVSRWQAALGVPRTGAVRLGELVFASGPVRVAALRAAPGGQAAPGAPLLDLTATRHTVTVQLDASRQQLVHTGDQVSVLMPDGRTSVPATVTDVSRVAVLPQAQGQGQGGGQQQPAIPITITLADEAAAATLDQAPVYVSITSASRRNVLAVPVIALLAQPDGGYAVAVRADGARRLVTVRPGLFGDGGLVEVAGDGLAAGQEVEVPVR